MWPDFWEAERDLTMVNCRQESRTRGPADRRQFHVPSPTMTTTSTSYLVAYPHPTIRPVERVKRFNIDPDTNVGRLLELLMSAYPNHAARHHPEGRLAISRSTSTLISTAGNWPQLYGPRPRFPKQVYDWIRKDDPGAVMSSFENLSSAFPEGPHETLKKEVEFVVVTPESASEPWFVSCDHPLNRSLQSPKR